VAPKCPNRLEMACQVEPFRPRLGCNGLGFMGRQLRCAIAQPHLIGRSGDRAGATIGLSPPEALEGRDEILISMAAYWLRRTNRNSETTGTPGPR
jgi:hypothetical protein